MTVRGRAGWMALMTAMMIVIVLLGFTLGILLALCFG